MHGLGEHVICLQPCRTIAGGHQCTQIPRQCRRIAGDIQDAFWSHPHEPRHCFLAEAGARRIQYDQVVFAGGACRQHRFRRDGPKPAAPDMIDPGIFPGIRQGRPISLY